jgi:hypothetical protein
MDEDDIKAELKEKPTNKFVNKNCKFNQANRDLQPKFRQHIF